MVRVAHLARLLLALKRVALGAAVAAVALLRPRVGKAAKPSRGTGSKLSPKAGRRAATKRKHEHEGRLLEGVVVIVVVVVVLIVVLLLLVVRAAAAPRLLRGLDPGEGVLDALERRRGVGRVVLVRVRRERESSVCFSRVFRGVGRRQAQNRTRFSKPHVSQLSSGKVKVAGGGLTSFPSNNQLN